MAANGTPESVPGVGEQEPLLGRAGDASQREGKPLYSNLIIGTAVLAQAGVWILVAIVWGAVFSHPLIFFSPHPLLNTAGLLLITEAILILQPTHTAEQKKQGTYVHLAANDFGLACLIAGLIIIEKNKLDHHGGHFESPHAILGFTTYVILLIQATVGFTMYFVPQLYRGESKAKAIWKYHRMSGYAVLTLSLATVCAATQTPYNKSGLGIQLWAVIACSVLILAGVLPRIKKQKLGL